MPAKKKTNDKYDRFSSAGGVAKVGTKSPYANLTKKNGKTISYNPTYTFSVTSDNIELKVST